MHYTISCASSPHHHHLHLNGVDGGTVHVSNPIVVVINGELYYIAYLPEYQQQRHQNQ